MCRIQAVEALHALWRDFAAKLVHAHAGASRLVRVVEEQLDFLGCKLTVIRAANPQHVGMTGVVVRNTAGAVTLAATSSSTHDDSLKEAPLRVAVLPKAGAVVEMRFPMPAGDATVQLAGAALRVARR